MVQGYFTLQEAAQFLNLSADELKQLAQKKEIRSFQDRGTLRFRVQDVHELGRIRESGSSEPDLVLHDALPATPKPAPKSPRPVAPKSPSHLAPKSPVQAGPKTPSGPRTPTKESAHSDDIFDFSLDVDDSVDIGREILSGGSKKSDPGVKSPVRSPQPPAGSDSDVKLVSTGEQEGSDSDVRLSGRDSDVKMPDSAAARTPKVVRKPAPGSGSPSPKKASRVSSPQPDSSPSKHPSRLGGPAQPADSGVRLVPMDSDSDVKIVGAGSEEIALGATPPQSSTDSDIRMEKYNHPAADSGEGEMPLTEEINLDEEIRKQEAALHQPQGKVKRKSKLKMPPTSPFELSESDIGQPKSAPQKLSMPDSSDFELAPAAPKDDSSDFDLGAASDGSGSVLLQPEGSDDFSLELAEENALGAEPSNLTGPSSGISLNNPVDAGISLEDGNPADSDYDLSLEVEATPKPAPAGAGGDSEFELTLDADDSGPQAAASPADSDSEFELTLDDSGGLAALDSQDAPAHESAEKDIFETDFEVPALEDDSGSQVAPLDPDLDSSDFDIALDDSAVEDESASQVVALDDESIDVDAESAEGFDDLAVAGEEEGEVAEVAEEVDDAKTVVKEKLVQPAPWGALPVAFMLPCVIVMVLVGLLGFELVQSAGGYKAPGYLTKAIGDMIGKPIK